MENENQSVHKQVWDLYKSIKPFSKENRMNMDGVYCNCEHVYVTNGHFMIRDVKSKDLTLQNVVVKPTGSFKPYIKGGEVDGVSLADANKIVTANGNVLQKIDAQYPDCDQLIKNEEKPHKLILNAKYLALIAEYLSSDEVVELQFDAANPLGPITITGNSNTTAQAVLMPCSAK